MCFCLDSFGAPGLWKSSELLTCNDPFLYTKSRAQKIFRQYLPVQKVTSSVMLSWHNLCAVSSCKFWFMRGISHASAIDFFIPGVLHQPVYFNFLRRATKQIAPDMCEKSRLVLVRRPWVIFTIVLKNESASRMTWMTPVSSSKK